MAKIHINNPKQVINGGAKKYYFKVKGLGGPKGDKGDTGATGPQGPQGPQGNAATVSVGSTTTLPVGQDATVQNVGTLYNAVLNFGIPQGPRGPQGATGATGAKGDKGDQGNPGPQGEKGTNATVYIGTTTTGEPGTQAGVYNSGTDSNAVLNFTIPRGDVGPMPTIAQTTGQATDQVMSQKATTDAIANETSSRQNADTALGGRIDTEIHNRQVADIGLQSQIDAITSKSDVVDVVANYAALQAYDKSTLGDNDVIKVLDDETHQDALTYYRWSTTTQTWTYIGQEAPYYSKSQTDTLLLAKQNTIDSLHKLSADLVDDTSTTNKFVTASDITNWNGKQDALTAGTGIDITSGIISTPAIVPEVVTELPTTGAEGKLYLTPKAHTTSTATGNPIEATVTEQAGQLESFQLDGDTAQQTYTGRNILPNNLQTQTINGVTFTRNADSSITIKGTATARTEPRLWQSSDGGSLVFASGANYFNTTSTTIYYYANAYYSILPNSASGAMPSDRNCSYAYIRVESGESIDTTIYPQIVEGDAALDYEPFVGGQPSPNPSYPQDINVVTGTQTISINGTNYPISLGSLELCKLGTYQDYIYKDGEDWKVHKATAIASASNREWEWADMSPNGWYFSHTNYGYYDINKINVISKSFIGVKRSVAPNTSGTFITIAGDGSIGIRNPNITGSSNVTQFTNWLNSLNTTWLYALKTPTDTAITDTTLIAQLEAIRTASLGNGANTITNTATGSNLAGDMEIGYFGFNPTNRYDKWLWLDLNNNYEQIGGE